jgi:hypothetical protein
MRPSDASHEAKPQVILVPRAQVTPDPVRGYTTSDFWRDLEARRRRSALELARLKRMVEPPPRNDDR